MELVLSSFGTCLSMENNAFLVTSAAERRRIPVDSVHAIQISRGASITSDAVLMAIDNEIPIIFVDRKGTPKGRIWSPKYGSISTIRKGQLAFAQSQAAVMWIKGIVDKKIANQQALILTMLHAQEEQKQAERAVHRLEAYRQKIAQLQGNAVRDVAAELRGWEGAAAKIYFEQMNTALPQNLRFAERTQHPALDPVNAMLNYGYGILYGKIEGALIKAGIDPYIGILHRDEYNRPVLVFDVIEIYRIWMDYVIYTLACQNSITDDFCSVRPDGAYFLETLGKRVLIQSFNDYLEELIEQDGLSRSRETHIQLYANQLAQKFRLYN